MSGARKKVEFVKPEEPKFLKEYKKKKGVKEESKIGDKYITEIDESKTVPLKIDELPVVIMDGEELTTEEKLLLVDQQEVYGKHVFKSQKEKESPIVERKTKKGAVKEKAKKADKNALSFEFEDE